MEKVIELLKMNKDLPEHPQYHPEGTTLKHIALTTIRAIMLSGDPNIILSAFFHDIMKFKGGKMESASFEFTTYLTDNKEGDTKKLITGDRDYWMNRKHSKLSEELIRSDDDIQYLIHTLGADVDTVAKICRYHMGLKVENEKEFPRKLKKVPNISHFRGIDCMIGRYDTPNRKNLSFKFYCNGRSGFPDSDYITGGRRYYQVDHQNIGYCRMTPLDLAFERGCRFTLCINRRPYAYSFSDIPYMIGGFDQYSVLGEMLREAMDVPKLKLKTIS